MQRPLVTIAIPAFRRLETLKEAVTSALAQTYSPTEIRIALNPSGTETDAAIENWCSEVCAQNPGRMNFTRQSRNLGMAGNWNALLDQARGEFVTILADDDRLLPEFVAKCMAWVQPGVALVFADHFLIDAQGRRDEAGSKRNSRVNGRAALETGILPRAEAAVWGRSVPICASVFRTAAARALRFREELNTPEFDFFLRLAQTGARFAFVKEALSEYRVHPDAATTAGLWYERLAPILEALPASPDLEPAKRRYLAQVFVDAATRALKLRDRELLRRILASRYYPGASHSPLLAVTHAAALCLPMGLVEWGLRGYQRARALGRRLLGWIRRG